MENAITSSVYILIDNVHKRLKIGKANDLASRLKSFSYAKLEHGEAIEIICRDEHAAKKIEKMLHAKFDDFKIPSIEIGEVDGKDEWFSLSIKDNLLSFIRQEDNRLIDIKEGLNPFEIQEEKKPYQKIEAKEGCQRQTIVYDIPKEWINAIKNKAHATVGGYMKAALFEKLKRDGYIQ